MRNTMSRQSSRFNPIERRMDASGTPRPQRSGVAYGRRLTAMMGAARNQRETERVPSDEERMDGIRTALRNRTVSPRIETASKEQAWQGGFYILNNDRSLLSPPWKALSPSDEDTSDEDTSEREPTPVAGPSRQRHLREGASSNKSDEYIDKLLDEFDS